MWEADKDVVRAFKECYKNALQEMRDGGEVDLSGTCTQETKALQSATLKASQWYMSKND